MRTWLMVAFVSALLSATAGSAKALTTLRGAGNDDENIYVAMVDVTGDGTHNKVPVVCFDSTNNTHDTYYIIGTTSGLDDDYQIHGDSTDGGTGSDSLQIGWTSSGYCGSITDTGGSANLAYNSWYLDLYGDGGNDRYLSDGGAPTTPGSTAVPATTSWPSIPPPDGHTATPATTRSGGSTDRETYSTAILVRTVSGTPTTASRCSTAATMQVTHATAPTAELRVARTPAPAGSSRPRAR